MMTVSLSGVCKNAASAIEAMVDELKDRMSEDEWDQFIVEHQPLSYVYMLRNEIAKHATQVAKGEETLAEFGRHYCLTEGDEQ